MKHMSKSGQSTMFIGGTDAFDVAHASEMGQMIASFGAGNTDKVTQE